VPTYQYACTECGDELEVVQRFSDDPLTSCGACGGRLRKVFSPVGIVFKGSGFYRTDSRSGSVNGASANGKSGGDGDGGSKTESGKSESGKSESGGSGTGKPESGSSGSDKSGSNGSSGGGSSGGSAKPAAGTGSKVA